MNNDERKAAGILIELAFQEDIGTGDITTESLIPVHERRDAFLIAKASGIIAGTGIVEMVFRKLDPQLEWRPKVDDGDRVEPGDLIAEFSATYRALLSGERTALNFLQRLSGIATASNAYVHALKGYNTKILDTRKTLPGFRLLDKFAVRAGGGTNHRIGLYDMVMIKDNHIAVAGGISKAVRTIRDTLGSEMKIEVETTSLEEVREAVDSGADIIMLDNMDNATMREAVELIGGRAMTEASGNMTVERLKEVAETGVDFISVGALTHSVVALDISQRISG